MAGAVLRSNPVRLFTMKGEERQEREERSTRYLTSLYLDFPSYF